MKMSKKKIGRFSCLINKQKKKKAKILLKHYFIEYYYRKINK